VAQEGGVGMQGAWIAGGFLPVFSRGPTRVSLTATDEPPLGGFLGERKDGVVDELRERESPTMTRSQD
jgi:hypothetical protein